MKRARGRFHAIPAIARTRTLLQTQARAADPVRCLRQVPKGPMYDLADYLDPRDRLHWIGIGRGSFNDIVLADEFVSEKHCLLQCTDRAVTVKDDASKNLTLVNGVPVFGAVQLMPGMLLTLGVTTLLVCGDSAEEQEPYILAMDVDEFLRAATKLYGSGSAAARAMEIAKTTLADWLRDGRFKRKRKPE